MSNVQLSQDYVETSVSHATMRDIDLFDAFIWFLDEHDSVKALSIREEYSHLLDEEGCLIDTDGYPNLLEDVPYLIEALFDALNEIAPEGTYFGAHPGDGSDYGFWQSEDEFEVD